MKPTKDCPTEDGFYWLIGILNLPQVVKVTDFGCSVWWPGTSDAVPMGAYRVMENKPYWVGPLPYPKGWVKLP